MPERVPAASPLPAAVRRAIAARVFALFNDAARGERPVQRRPDGLFGPGSVAWRVHGDVTTMMVGGMAALMLQMLHPAVLAGVWDHSDFRSDLAGRLRRTARFIALTTYGGGDEAEAAIARVRRIHARVRGALPDGTPYAATDPDLLAWVHATETTSFLAAWRRYADPAMSMRAQDRYFAEMASIGRALGADPVPRSRAGMEDFVRNARASLRHDERTRVVSRILLAERSPDRLVQPVQTLTVQAAIDLLPGWARRMHGLATPPLAVPLLRAGTYGIAGTLRWALR